MAPFGPPASPADVASPTGLAGPASAAGFSGAVSPGEFAFTDPAIPFGPIAAPPEADALSKASFGERLGAHLIDQLAILLAAWFVGRPFGAMLGGFVYASSMPTNWDVMSYVGALLVAAFTSFVFEVFWIGSHLQATPGKRVLRLKVTDLRGRPIGVGHAFGRYLMKGLSGSVFCIGFLMQPYTAKKQALHDLLAGTLVLRG